jgi:ribose 5-phosphate isomerase A
MSTIEEQKREAAERGVADEVRSGMAVGLGTGSTARYVTEAIGRLLAAGALHDVVGVPTSEATATLARRVGVPLASLDECAALDVCLDGADEIAPGLALVKGLGGALLREKVVASAAARLCIVADGGKRVTRLGERAPVPVEVIGFAVPVCRAGLARLGSEPVLRLGADGAPFTTDEGNRILDCCFGPIADPLALGAAIHAVPGVVEHGLFVGMADVAYVAGDAGVEILRP